MKNPLVSVIINNFNYGRFLGHAIESVLEQNYPKREIIVVDDGSTDNSREVIKRYERTGRIVAVFKANGGRLRPSMQGLDVQGAKSSCFSMRMITSLKRPSG